MRRTDTKADNALSKSDGNPRQICRSWISPSERDRTQLYVLPSTLTPDPPATVADWSPCATEYCGPGEPSFLSGFRRIKGKLRRISPHSLWYDQPTALIVQQDSYPVILQSRTTDCLQAPLLALRRSISPVSRKCLSCTALSWREGLRSLQ